MKGKEYQSVDIEDSLSTEDFTSVEQENAEAKFVRLRFFAVISTMCLVVFGVVMYLNSNRESQITQLRSSSSTVSKVMHISDTHIDFFFDPNKSMKSGECCYENLRPHLFLLILLQFCISTVCINQISRCLPYL